MSELLKEFKQYLRENEESYKNGARDSIEYPLGYEEVNLLLNEIERLNSIIEKLEQENTVLKTQVVNKDKYSYGIRMGSDKE